MTEIAVRKIVVTVEEVRHDGGPVLATPILKGSVACIVKNPFAGRHEPEIAGMMDALKPLGLECSTKLLQALGGDPARIEAYGKGSLVGAAGELEHGALWHVPGGYAMRELLGQALAIVPSMTKVGAMGASLDVPIHHKDAAYVRSHFDGVTVAVADAPRADEILFALAMTTGGRPHARVGGLRQDEITKRDGLR
ncbi:amino acid synthesis family protein [Methylobacterium oryzihabitans]|uniref:Amino acid synthesis family protein n=1 Tax=Methylobacterium oryzihabitans TaxID=2499852 RepID=A0A437NZP1_9HYPH|nr:amino acid synthesis family protein [Methylobacterium oryzihabitans]RVU15483.1 amino acid synthesis family protein [Methylobacterium oryzihabitans]